MGLFDFLKGRQQSPDMLLAEAYQLVDERLNAGVVRSGEQLLKAMQAGIKEAAKGGEAALIAEYHSCLKGIDNFRDRAVRIAFADLGELQRAIFDMRLEAAVREYIEKRLEPLLELIKQTVAEDSAYALGVIRGTIPKE